VESFDSEEEAAGRRERLELEARSNATVKVAEALQTYAVHLDDKGNRPRPIECTIQRLTVLFRLVLQRPVGALHAAREGLVEALQGYRFGQPTRTLSVASKRNLVNQGKTF
jgi:hypothetical protein